MVWLKGLEFGSDGADGVSSFLFSFFLSLSLSLSLALSLFFFFFLSLSLSLSLCALAGFVLVPLRHVPTEYLFRIHYVSCR